MQTSQDDDNDFSGIFYGRERISQYHGIVEYLWTCGVADNVTRVIVDAWNKGHCRPPLDSKDLAELSAVPLIAETMLLG